jgi:hypothetical protein
MQQFEETVKLCLYSTANGIFSIFHISIRINCNPSNDGLLHNGTIIFLMNVWKVFSWLLLQIPMFKIV